MIRNATEEDLDAILEIYNDAILNTTAIYTYEPETSQNRLKWFIEKMNNHLPILVYEVDGVARGFASYGQFRQYPAYQFTIEHSVYVHKEYRKRSIGSSLLRELIANAKENGYMTMVGAIDGSNQESRTLHERFGFDFVGIIHNAGYKFERWLDLAFYELHLG